MKILLTGSSGLVGSAAVSYLTAQGHDVKRLLRFKPASSRDVAWNPPEYGPDPADLEGIEAVVHLAGESIAARWTATKKQAIRDSRVQGTRLLVESLKRMRTPPKVLVCASAIGYYGNHEAGTLREIDPSGNDFLAEVCREWESAAAAAEKFGTRVVNLRFGIILSAKGGALGKMLLPFKLGLGGRIASGRQVMSWIALDDILGIIHYTLMHDGLRGPVNVVAPHPVSNTEFTRALGRVLKRPTIFPMPAPVVRLVFGEMGETLLVGGMRVEPAKLIQNGYTFAYPEVEGALRHVLKP